MERAMTVARHHMVVDQPAGLHGGIDDGGTAEAKATLLEVLRYRFGQGRRSRHVPAAAEAVLQRLVANEVPEIAREVLVFRKLEIGLRIGDAGLDLEPVAHDAFVLHQALQLAGIGARPDLRLQTLEGLADGSALAQDCNPRKSGLEAVEQELLEKGA